MTLAALKACVVKCKHFMQVKQAVSKKDEALTQMQQKLQAAIGRCQHLEELIDRQHRDLLDRKKKWISFFVGNTAWTLHEVWSPPSTTPLFYFVTWNRLPSRLLQVYDPTLHPYHASLLCVCNIRRRNHLFLDIDWYTSAQFNWLYFNLFTLWRPPSFTFFILYVMKTKMMFFS